MAPQGSPGLGGVSVPPPPPPQALSVGATVLPRKGTLPGGQESWISASVLLVISSYVPGQLHHHSDPQFPHLESEQHVVPTSWTYYEE